jgi:uncharacterized protein YecT (DUF1311 family)
MLPQLMPALSTLLLLSMAIASATAAENEESKCCCTTYDTSVCLSNVGKKVDAEQSTTYQKALIASQRFGNKAVDDLKEAETQWLAYRGAECKAEYDRWGGGSGGPNALTMCKIRITRQRIAELKSRYHVH